MIYEQSYGKITVLCAYCGGRLEPVNMKSRKAYARKWTEYQVMKCPACDYGIRADRLKALLDMKMQKIKREISNSTMEYNP
jgi:hypothetical protein